MTPGRRGTGRTHADVVHPPQFPGERRSPRASEVSRHASDGADRRQIWPKSSGQKRPQGMRRRYLKLTNDREWLIRSESGHTISIFAIFVRHLHQELGQRVQTDHVLFGDHRMSIKLGNKMAIAQMETLKFERKVWPDRGQIG